MQSLLPGQNTYCSKRFLFSVTCIFNLFGFSRFMSVCFMSKHGKYVLTPLSLQLALNLTVYVAVACCIAHPLYTDKVSGTKNPGKLYRLQRRKINIFVLENCVNNPVSF